MVDPPRLTRTYGCRAACRHDRRLGVKHVVTSEKDGPNSTFEKELVDADVVISQPFWPAYLTAGQLATEAHSSDVHRKRVHKSDCLHLSRVVLCCSAAV